MGVPWGFGLTGTGDVNVGRDAGVVKIPGNRSQATVASPDERSEIRARPHRAQPRMSLRSCGLQPAAERNVRDILEQSEVSREEFLKLP
jgi:hypothetical protein